MQKQSKCKYCKTTTNTLTIGVGGAYNKNWNSCEEHRKKAREDRDEFLKEKIGKTYDEIITPPIIENKKLDEEI